MDKNYTKDLEQYLKKNDGDLEAALKEMMRNASEKVINSTMNDELNDFLDYEKYHKTDVNNDNSRNGFYGRKLDTSLGSLTLRVPRDRKGDFRSELFEPYSRRTEDFAYLISKLYSMNATTRDIEDMIEQYFGNKVSKSCVSNLTNNLIENIDDFKKRRLEKRYFVVYLDATYLPIRRDSVSREAILIALGVRTDGTKEVISYLINPTENLDAYQTMFNDFKKRGIKQVDLFVSDGFVGIKDLIKSNFPESELQSCYVHFERNVLGKVRPRDRVQIMEDLRDLKNETGYADALVAYIGFARKWDKVYPKLNLLKADKEHLFTFMKFPIPVRRFIYTNNIIESLNKQIKRYTKVRIQFPTEVSLEKILVTIFTKYSNSIGQRRLQNIFMIDKPIKKK